MRKEEKIKMDLCKEVKSRTNWVERRRVRWIGLKRRRVG